MGKNPNFNEEALIVDSLVREGFSKPEIQEVCEEPSLNLDINVVSECLERFPRGTKTPGYKGEVRTLKIKKLFYGKGEFTKKGILNTLRQEGIIGSGLLGRLRGELILMRIQPLEEREYIGYYFFKDKRSGRFHLTYAGGQD